VNRNRDGYVPRPTPVAPPTHPCKLRSAYERAFTWSICRAMSNETASICFYLPPTHPHLPPPSLHTNQSVCPAIIMYITFLVYSIVAVGCIVQSTCCPTTYTVHLYTVHCTLYSVYTFRKFVACLLSVVCCGGAFGMTPCTGRFHSSSTRWPLRGRSLELGAAAFHSVLPPSAVEDFTAATL
jgi:hypothetical protein